MFGGSEGQTVCGFASFDLKGGRPSDGFGALLISWSFVVPIFEAPDEPAHWEYVRYLRVNKRLPVYGPFSVEANSPPLYYLLVAPFANYSDIPPRLTWPGATGTVTPALPRFFQVRVVLPGYWPPPRMAFPGRVKTLAPVQSRPAPADELVLPNESTQFVIETDVPTDQYNYSTFTLKGTPDRGMVTGALYLGFLPGSSEQHKIQFDWICDGSVHAVTVPLWTYPEWGGRLAQVRVAPLDSAGTSNSGLLVHIGNIVMVSSLSSTHGP